MGADINRKTQTDGSTPLLVALQSGNSVAAARYLVEMCADKIDVNLAGPSFGSPLHAAVFLGSLERDCHPPPGPRRRRQPLCVTVRDPAARPDDQH